MPYSLHGIRRNLLLLAAFSTFALAALLRLTSNEIRAFAYLQDHFFCCALAGLSLGTIFWRWRLAAFRAAGFDIFALILAMLGLIHFSCVKDLALLHDATTYMLYPVYLDSTWLNDGLMIATALLFSVLYLSCFIFFGNRLRLAASQLPPVESVSLFFGGSALGWVLYAAAAGFGARPLVLGLIAAAGFIVIYKRSPRSIALAVVCIVSCLMFGIRYSTAAIPEGELDRRGFWTPDGHVEIWTPSSDDHSGEIITLNRNITGAIVDTSKNPLSRLPFLFVPQPKHVLVLGSGANEAAEALSHGALQVDVVDPRRWMFKLAGEHPQKPYSSHTVTRIVEDPRQFLKLTKHRYDLIISGGLQGTESFSPLAHLRQYDFANTTEAFDDLKHLLTRNGYLVNVSDPVRHWLVERIARNIFMTFGRIDEFIKVGDNYADVVSRTQDPLMPIRIAEQHPELIHPGVVENLMQESGHILPTTDDWPFTSILVPGFTRTQLLCFILLAAAILMHVRRLWLLPAEAAGTSACGSLRFKLLSAAYMLAAAKCVMTLAFNFGTGWEVAVGSCIALFGLSWLGGRISLRIPLPVLWICTIGSISTDFSFNYEAVGSITEPLLGLAAGGLLPVLPPMLISGLLSTTSDAESNPLGAFFVGALAGFVLSYFCLLIGISQLDFGTGLLVVAAMLMGIRFGRRKLPCAES